MSNALVQMMCKSLNYIGVVEFHGGQLVIKDQTGQVKFSCAPELAPFLQANADGCLVAITLVKAAVTEVKEDSQIIMPDKKLILPS